MDQWEVKTTCLSYTAGEINTGTAAVNRNLVVSRYRDQISKIFNK